MRPPFPGWQLMRDKQRFLRRRVHDLEHGLGLRDRALAAVSDGVFLADPTLPDDPVLYVNPHFEELTGYVATEVIGRSWGILAGPETEPARLADLRTAARAGRNCEVQMICYRQGGIPFRAFVRLNPVLGPSGAVTHLLFVLNDAEQRLRLEAQLRQAQKMATLGRLAAGVAHDYNNLLTSILGYSELLLAEHNNSELFHEGLVQIKKAGDRAASLTRQILDHSRQRLLELRPLDLAVVVADLEKMLCRLIGEDIELVTVLPPGVGVVRADLTQTEQLLLNLAANARDAMPRGGKLMIETANVRFDEAYARAHPEVGLGWYTMLAVSDTGCGMDARTKARLFEPFFTTKEPGKGTGLGLAGIHAIVRQCEGHIAVYSEVGHGTTFKAYLPHVAAPSADEAGVAATVTALPQGTETVLLVEDDDMARNLIRSVLQRTGYHVLEARDGEEAVRVGEGHAEAIDLLVTDVVLPRCAGPVVAERLSHRWPGMKVLYTSGYTDTALIQHGFLEAGRAFLPKPLTVEGLARKAREVLDRTPPPAAGGEASLGTRVLLVEDDATTREALESFLRNRGYAVIAAGDGREALARLRGPDRPALILLDLMMPVMDGWEFREEQCRDGQIADVPVVIISAAGDAHQKAAALGAVGYLQKPVEVDELLAHMQRYCASRAAPAACS